jgi:hypothetical protein
LHFKIVQNLTFYTIKNIWIYTRKTHFPKHFPIFLSKTNHWLLGFNRFLSILWCLSSGNHPYSYLAKFGDIQNMKVEKS